MFNVNAAASPPAHLQGSYQVRPADARCGARCGWASIFTRGAPPSCIRHGIPTPLPPCASTANVRHRRGPHCDRLLHPRADACADNDAGPLLVSACDPIRRRRPSSKSMRPRRRPVSADSAARSTTPSAPRIGLPLPSQFSQVLLLNVARAAAWLRASAAGLPTRARSALLFRPWSRGVLTAQIDRQLLSWLAMTEPALSPFRLRTRHRTHGFTAADTPRAIGQPSVLSPESSPPHRRRTDQGCAMCVHVENDRDAALPTPTPPRSGPCRARTDFRTDFRM